MTAGASHLVPVIELGGTHVTAALVDLAAGTVVRSTVRRHVLDPASGASEIMATVIDCAREVPAERGAGWGVAIPGPFDYERGVGMFTGVGKFEALYGVDIRAALLAGLPGPPGNLTFLNDAHAFLWGEWHFGAGTGYDPCAAVTLGTGIGSAFVAGGALRRSGRGIPPEGRVDLICIDGQPLEDVVSTRAIERAYRQATGSSPRGAAQIAAQARSGDQAASEVFRHAFEVLGSTLRPLLEDFGAQALVVGGSMTGSWDIVGPPLLAGMRGSGGTHLAGLVVAVASHPEHAALLGAGAFARGRQGPSRPSEVPVTGGGGPAAGP